MVNNKLIKADRFWHKLKRFWNNIFSNQANVTLIKDTTVNKSTDLFAKERLIKKVKNGEIDIYELDDDQVDELTEYFQKDIESKTKELARVKEHILKMRKELNIE